MKKNEEKELLGLTALLHVIICPVCILINRAVVCQWKGVLGGEPLPAFTNFALVLGYIWPCIFLVLHILIFILAFKVEKKKIFQSAYMIYTLEIIIFTLTVFGYIFPNFSINYGLGV